MTRLRTRPLALAATALALLAGLVAARPADADASGLTRVRLDLSTTSDWATAQLTGVVARASHTTATTPGARLWERGTEWTLVRGGTGPAVATIDLVLDVPPGARPALVLRKGREGTATVELSVRNGTTARAAHLHLATQDPRFNEVTKELSASVLDAGGLPVHPVDDRRLTLASYYPWFGAGAPQNPRIGPDRPVHPYATDDPASVTAMVDQAVGAGVDGFLVSWEGDRHAGPVQLLVDAAARHEGFSLAPLVELRALSRTTLLGRSFDPAVAAAATRSFLARAASSQLRVDGRPVVFTFGMWDLDPRQWAAYRLQLADLDPFIVGDRWSPDHPVEGIYEYDPNPYGPDALAARAARAVDVARLRPLVDPAATPLLWAATVSPGYDTTASQPLWNARRTSRAGGWRYDMTWEVAMAAEPDWALITSWNEWYEQTHVVPGTRTGTLALEQTARWAERFASTVPVPRP